MVVRGFLKFLGGLLAALLILGVILGAAGYFALRNLDPNMFRAEFERYLTQQTGFRVELGDIKFQWKPQPQLQVAGLKFYHPKSLEKILQSDQVRIDADLTSVLQKHFSMSEIVIQSPEIFLKRDGKGVWNWQVVKDPDAPVAVAAPVSARESFIPTAEASEGTEDISLKNLDRVAEGWEFGVGKILVRDATIHFTDETVEPVYKMEIERFDVDVRQKTPASPFHFTAEGSVFNSAKRNLEAEGDLDLASQSLDLLLRYGPEKAVFQGRLKAVNNMPHFEGTLEVRDLDMDSVIPAVYKKGDYVTGRLSAKAQLSFEGANPAALQRSLKGQGTIGILDGALRNRNLIKEVFDRLSPVLAVTNALGGELPPELKEMLKDRDTPFQSLQVLYEVQSGSVKVSEFRLMHPNYQLSGRGTYGILDKRVDGSMQLFLSQAISAYLMKKIHEMELLADRNGQVMIPFRYSGVFPDAAVQPDLGYIGSRMLQGGTDQLLNRGLEQLSKYLERKTKK
ncbi:MAG: AsmA family protein [Candidatus Omnitrophica bacterium]|nr:AsmA family protein [Candidatus Omnitrophota bacterium]